MSNPPSDPPVNPVRPRLADQLRSDMAVARRNRDDADHLVTVLDMAASLAERADMLLAENAEYQRHVAQLQRQIEELTPAGDEPEDADPTPDPTIDPAP